MKDMEEIILIKELDSNDNLMELLDLSKDFFYEYENNHELFKIDVINELDIRNYFNNFIGNDRKIAYIAINEKKIVGYITLYYKDQPSYWTVKEIGEISGLMVNKNFRQNGIAGMLIIKAIEYFKQKGIEYYTVFTSVNNTKGISLYEKYGLKPLQTVLFGKIE